MTRYLDLLWSSDRSGLIRGNRSRAAFLRKSRGHRAPFGGRPAVVNVTAAAPAGRWRRSVAIVVSRGARHGLWRLILRPPHAALSGSYLSVNGESCRDDEADYADRLFHCSMLPTEKFERKDSELVFRAAHCAPPCLKPQEFLKVIAIKLLLRLRSASPSVKPLVLLEFCRERSAPSAETRSLQLPVVI